MNKCESCPVDPGQACHARAYPARFGYWCALARAGRPIDLQMIRGRSAIATPPGGSRTAALRALKPRVRLGVDQHKIPPPGCTTCGGSNASRESIPREAQDATAPGQGES